jgi:hypothetical protein
MKSASNTPINTTLPEEPLYVAARRQPGRFAKFGRDALVT